MSNPIPHPQGREFNLTRKGAKGLMPVSCRGVRAAIGRPSSRQPPSTALSRPGTLRGTTGYPDTCGPPPRIVDSARG